MTIKIFLLGTFFMISTFFSPFAMAEKVTVVELFTSQGCSSCPPADRFLGELVEDEGTIALSFHVDYWDYIGWMDPFAQPAFTSRQRTYAQHLSGRVYTPAIVVNGQADAVGSDRRAVRSLFKRTTQPEKLMLKREGEAVVFDVPKEVAAERVRLLLVGFDRGHVTDVRRGENHGRRLKNRNVVTFMEPLAAGVRKIVPPQKTDGLAVLVQKFDGQILAAGKILH